MSADALYREIGLEGYRVEDTWQGKDGALYVLIAVPRDSLRCRNCGCSRVHLHDSRQRFWKAAPFGLTPVFVTMKSPRVKCLQCGSRTWHQPTFAQGQRQITKKFELFLEACLSRLTIQDVVEMFGVSWNTVCEIDIRRLKKLSRPGLAGLKRLAIDEVYLGKQHKFITLVVDLDTRAVVSVAPGRGLAGLQGIFLRLKRAGAQVQAVATDMAGGYIAAVLEYLPKARLVYDRFHVLKLMNDKLTTLRRDLYREAAGPMHRQVLKGIRWLLLKNPDNLQHNKQVDESQRLEDALKLNRSLAVAYYLKEDLGQFWNQKSILAAERFLEDWSSSRCLRNPNPENDGKDTPESPPGATQLVHRTDFHGATRRNQQQDRCSPATSLRIQKLRTLQATTAHSPLHQIRTQWMITPQIVG